MTPAEKANQIIDKFYDVDIYDLDTPNFKLLKEYALICVDEIAKAEINVLRKFNIVNGDYESNYWNEVKNQIEKL